MLRDSLLAILYYLQVNPKHYCLDDGNQMNKYVCIQEGDAWKVYFNENNKRIEERSFNTESDAYNYFLRFIAVDPKVLLEDDIEHFYSYYFDRNITFTLDLLSKVLDELRISHDSYSFTEYVAFDKYILRYEENKWHYYYSERGKKFNEIDFISEDEACRFFLWDIAGDFAVRKKD